MNFDIQSFLSEMREEQRQDMRELTAKVEDVKTSISSHEVRLTSLETDIRRARWTIGTLFVGVVGLVMDYFKSHK